MNAAVMRIYLEAKRLNNSKFLTAGFLFLFIAGVCSTQAAPKTTTWNGNGENWTNELSWSAGIPADGDDVVINGNVVLTNSTPFLNSYTNNAGIFASQKNSICILFKAIPVTRGTTGLVLPTGST